jgi:hypothetical protein
MDWRRAGAQDGGAVMMEWKGPTPTTVEAIPFFDGTSAQAKLAVKIDGEWVVFVREPRAESVQYLAPK